MDSVEKMKNISNSRRSEIQPTTQAASHYNSSAGQITNFVSVKRLSYLQIFCCDTKLSALNRPPYRNKYVTFLQPEKSLLEHPPQAYFRLIIHGGVEDVTSLKISAESHMLEAQSSILEGLDHLWKLFWIFGIEYTPGCENFFHLLQKAVYKLDYETVFNSLN